MCGRLHGKEYEMHLRSRRGGVTPAAELSARTDHPCGGPGVSDHCNYSPDHSSVDLCIYSNVAPGQSA